MSKNLNKSTGKSSLKDEKIFGPKQELNYNEEYYQAAFQNTSMNPFDSAVKFIQKLDISTKLVLIVEFMIASVVGFVYTVLISNGATPDGDINRMCFYPNWLVQWAQCSCNLVLYNTELGKELAHAIKNYPCYKEYLIL